MALLPNNLEQFDKGEAILGPGFRKKLNDNFARVIHSVKVGPGLQIQQENGEVLLWAGDDPSDGSRNNGTPMEITVVTGVRVNGTELQYKTRRILAVPFEDESDWTTFHTGTECP